MISLTGPSLKPVTFTADDGRRVRRRVTDGAAKGAEAVAQQVRDAAPVRSGALRESVRVTRDREDRVSIRAGGTPETQRPTRRGKTYDEALLAEYGSSREAPQPFFYPTIRGERADLDKAAQDALPDPMDR